MLEQAAEQKAADFLHGMLRGESDGCNEMVLLAATLYLAQEVLSHGDKKKQNKNNKTHERILQPDSGSSEWLSGLSFDTFTVWS